MNYRKFYSQCIGKEVPKSFHIHHIDYDRENNKITNLVALPEKLHNDFHRYCTLSRLDIEKKLCGNCVIYIESITQYINTFYECSKWVDYRDHLLNPIIPNFHNLSYES